jgi:hypothetical protein
MTAGATLIGALAAFGVITPDQATATTAAATQVGGLVVTALAPAAYARSRGKAKAGK